MADQRRGLTLDTLFERLERMRVPEGVWHLHTLPEDGGYRGGLSLGFGDDIDLTGTPVGLVLRTDEFPRD
ncbi:hypothetical protein ACIGZH_20580 [Streptomyces sp. NPDC058319]|uniref:hypothetical protein n=1 Tax=unclassified Streptomyces TaxID=2593676 RepID=UPI0036E2F124